jgi:hypothetical protein
MTHWKLPSSCPQSMGCVLYQITILPTTVLLYRAQDLVVKEKRHCSFIPQKVRGLGLELPSYPATLRRYSWKKLVRRAIYIARSDSKETRTDQPWDIYDYPRLDKKYTTLRTSYFFWKKKISYISKLLLLSWKNHDLKSPFDFDKMIVL